MKHLLSVTIAFASLTVACSAFLGHGPHVPGPYAGATEITIVNAGDAPVCLVSLFQDGVSSGKDNWLGDKSKQANLAPGARQTFSIKPGTYHVLGGFCDTNGQFVAAVGTYGAATKPIDGPTLIVFGPLKYEPVEGMKTLAFTQFYRAGQGGGGGEAGAAEEPAAEEPASSEDSSSSESSSSSENKTEEPSPAKGDQNCKPSGATCDQSYQCCSGACVTHSPDDYCR
jgi:hypothetical protein